MNATAATDRCEKCADVLAYYSRHEDDPGRPGARRLTTEVACLTCGHPVPRDHPLQLEQDRAWAAKRAREAADAARPRPPSGMSGLAYGDTAEAAGKEYAALRADVAALREQVTALAYGDTAEAAGKEYAALRADVAALRADVAALAAQQTRKR